MYLTATYLAALTLTFQVTCDIILGTAPTGAECLQRKNDGDISLTGDAGRRRRATRRAAAEYSETTRE